MTHQQKTKKHNHKHYNNKKYNNYQFTKLYIKLNTITLNKPQIQIYKP